jgi:C4-dicarboxylate-specific signal transduction histidine kinase
MSLPQGLLNAQRWNTVVGLPMLSSAVGAYAFFTIKKAEEETAREKEDLKIAQRQLIQSEKMASLGELTAGIAHEIQNPLNFVNNFSELNNELISELVEEADKGNLAEIKTIAEDIKENEQKINYHGKRAMPL